MRFDDYNIPLRRIVQDDDIPQQSAQSGEKIRSPRAGLGLGIQRRINPAVNDL